MFYLFLLKKNINLAMKIRCSYGNKKLLISILSPVGDGCVYLLKACPRWYRTPPD